MRKLIGGLVSFFAGVVTGLLLGYAAGVALAPVGGDEARARLRREAQSLSSQPREFAVRARSRVETAVDEGLQAAAEKSRELAGEAGLDREPPLPTRDLPV